MIASSWRAKALSLCMALVFTGAALWTVAPEEQARLEGGQGVPAMRAGVSFADLHAGTLTPTRTLASAEILHADGDSAAIAPRPVGETLQGLPTAGLAPEEIAPAKQATSVAPTPDSAPRLDPPAPARENAALANPSTFAPRARPKDLPRLPEPQRSAPHADPPQAATTGAATSERSTGVSEGSEGRAGQQGSAARANYPGLVQSRILRTPLPATLEAGHALVQFTIGSDGGLASLSIARSSGSAAFDRAAAGFIRRAAPFPPPPRGAQRRFVLPVAVR
jgi:periplasmic protein TonB